MDHQPDIAIVITTYRRQDLLRVLLESISALKVGPAAVIVVDNEDSPETRAIAEGMGVDRYIGMSENTGGAGGFSRGVREAYERGHDWIWLMDDDVRVLPDAIERLGRWTAATDAELAAGAPLAQTVGAFQPFRRNPDGSFFYWQYRFSKGFGMQDPLASADRALSRGSVPMSCICFEGGLVHRRAVEAAGLPDARFFIYADDTIYGYCLSKRTRMLFINEYALERTRVQESLRVGGARKLNAGSDMTRYHIMRNRGHMARYLKANGDYNPLLFRLGTTYTLAKEVIRLFVGGSAGGKRKSLAELRRGMRDARAILRDASWQPYADVAPLQPSTAPCASAHAL